MKGLELSMIGYFIIALATIVLVIILVETRISPSLKSAYCSFVRGLRSFLPLPSHMKPPLPDYCTKDVVYVETKNIESGDPDKIEFLIASYVLACWEKTGKLNIGQNTLCYELILKEINPPGVTESSVSQKLSEGDFERMTWKIEDTITIPKSIGISYNSTSKKIEVS